MNLRKIVLRLLLGAVILCCVYTGGVFYYYRLVEVSDFRGIKIGDTVRRPYPFYEAPYADAKFFVYLLYDNFDDPWMVDQECGDYANWILEAGGHVLAASDGKFVEDFNIGYRWTKRWTQLLRLKKPTPHGFEYDASLMVVTDASDNIVKLHKNAQLRHLKRISKLL